MSSSATSHNPDNAGPERFSATHWSVVLAAGQVASPQAEAALARLCQTYWYPLYAFIRREGHDPHEAQDLTQDFFARFLEKNYLSNVDPRKGKFRSFLLASLKHFLANEWDRRQAAKRGGGHAHIPLDELTAENLYRLEPTHDYSAERVFERRWALTLLEQTLNRLREELASAGKSALFDALKVYLTGEKAVVSQAEVAARLRMSEGAVKVAVHRLRQRYRDLIRDEIAQTVAGPAEIEEELRHLVEALRP